MWHPTQVTWSQPEYSLHQLAVPHSWKVNSPVAIYSYRFGQFSNLKLKCKHQHFILLYIDTKFKQCFKLKCHDFLIRKNQLLMPVDRKHHNQLGGYWVSIQCGKYRRYSPNTPLLVDWWCFCPLAWGICVFFKKKSHCRENVSKQR